MDRAYPLAPRGNCHDKPCDADTGRIPHHHAGADGQRRGETDRFPEAGLRRPREGTVHGFEREDRARGGQLGDSIVQLSDAIGEWKPVQVPLLLYVTDTDSTYRQALKAGATSLREPMDAFYGDRTAGVKDSFGNSWWIATHQEDVSREELDRRAEAEMKK